MSLHKSEVYSEDKYMYKTDLNEIFDLARNNAIRSLMHIFFGILLASFVIVIDHPLIGIASLDLQLSSATSNIFWIGKWFFVLGVIAYVLVAFSHLFRSIRHTSEVHFLRQQANN